MNFVQYLLEHFQLVNEQEYIPTHEIIERMNTVRNEPITSDTFLRRTVVGKARDAGVLIASNSQEPSGYKIPCSEKDIDDFVKHFTSISIPMLHRLDRARECLKDATQGELDILDVSQHAEAKYILDAMKEMPKQEIGIFDDTEQALDT